MLEEIFCGCQRQEWPSIPYTPSNFWQTIKDIPDVRLVAGREPIMLEVRDSYTNERGLENPTLYNATFYSAKHDVVIIYDWKSSEATLTLSGTKEKIKEVSEIIFKEHGSLFEKKGLIR